MKTSIVVDDNGLPIGTDFFPDFLEALAKASKIFQTIVVVTNQQGVGKGKMTMEMVNSVHEKMLSKINESGGRIDKIYIGT